MNNTNTLQQYELEEIGRHTAEILGKGFALSFENSELSGLPELYNVAAVKAPKLFFKNGQPLLDSLREIVDEIRIRECEPTLDEELAELIKADQQHANAPLVEIGQDARCTCGSSDGILFDGSVEWLMQWRTGQLLCETPEAAKINPLGKCYTCGKYWTTEEKTK